MATLGAMIGVWYTEMGRHIGEALVLVEEQPVGLNTLVIYIHVEKHTQTLQIIQPEIQFNYLQKRLQTIETRHWSTEAKM